MESGLARRLFVTASMVFCLVGTLFGTGVLGERVEESSGGALSAEATLIAPAGPAFSIWSVIYLGLIAYTVWQWLPRGRDTAVERAIGWLAGWSMILNAAWLLVTQVGWIWVSVLVILGLAVVLGFIIKRLTGIDDRELPERIVVDGTFGLYLGWVTAASCANIAAAGASSGIEFSSGSGAVLASVVLVVAVGIGVVYQVVFGPRFAVAAALAWAFAWIGVGRTLDEPQSIAVGIVAFTASALAAVTWLAVAAKRSNTRDAEAAHAAEADD